MAKYTQDELIEILKEFDSKKENDFRAADFFSETEITSHQVYTLFPNGGWKELKERAGLEPHPGATLKNSDEELIKEYHRIVETVGNIPSWVVFGSLANISGGTLRRRFGRTNGVLRRYRDWLLENDPISPRLSEIEKKLTSGGDKTEQKVLKTEKDDFVDVTRITELKEIKSDKFDLRKLIRLCEEINMAWANESYIAVSLLGRTIINYVPPIFGFESFNEVANNYSSRERQLKSFKQSLQNLQKSLRNIADSHAHDMIRKKEVLPVRVQVSFFQDLDVLLSEIIRILR